MSGLEAGKELIISAKGLRKDYGSFEAVRGVDFGVKPGECLGLLGPNGAGKSTIVKMIYGFTPKSSGELYVLGRNIDVELRAIKAGIGIVPQEDNLDPELTIWDNLLIYAGYFQIPHDIAVERVEEVLQFMELTEKKNEVVQSLSGGMKRRLTLGRALLNQPRLLILDEPTTGLDPYARHILWQRLRKLKEAGTTMLLTTHYLEEASQLCDRLVILYKGEIIEEGSPQHLIDKHVGKEVLELGIAPEQREALLAEAASLMNASQLLGDNVLLFTNEGEALSALVSEKEKTMGFSCYYRRLRPSTLEDVFFKLTGESLENFSGD